MSEPTAEIYPRLRITMQNEPLLPLALVAYQAYGLSRWPVVEHVLEALDDMTLDKRGRERWHAKDSEEQTQFLRHAMGLDTGEESIHMGVQQMRLESPWMLVVVLIGGSAMVAAQTAHRLLDVWDHYQRSRVGKAKADVEVEIYKSLTQRISDHGVNYEALHESGLDNDVRVVSAVLAATDTIEALPSARLDAAPEEN